VSLHNRPKTILCDLDGTLIRHTGDITKQASCEPEVLPGVYQKLKEWELKGYRLFLVTGRKESCRKETEEQLAKAGIHYDALIMSATNGERILINDRKPNSEEDTTRSINVTRNAGLLNIDT